MQNSTATQPESTATQPESDAPKFQFLIELLNHTYGQSESFNVTTNSDSYASAMQAALDMRSRLIDEELSTKKSLEITIRVERPASQDQDPEAVPTIDEPKI